MPHQCPGAYGGTVTSQRNDNKQSKTIRFEACLQQTYTKWTDEKEK